MKTYEVTAKKQIGDEQREVTVTTEFGETVEESVQAFGGDVVNSNFIANAKIALQAAMRRLMEAGKADVEIAATCADWRPGVSIQRSVDPAAAMLAKFGSMTADEQAEYIEALKARAAGK